MGTPGTTGTLSQIKAAPTEADIVASIRKREISMLNTPFERLGYIIEKAREFDAETAPVDSDSGSNPSDDGEVGILEDTTANPARQELAAALDGLDNAEKIEVLALVWLGRGDFTAAEWPAALAQAREIHDARETAYLVGTPLLADYLAEGLAALGFSAEDYEVGFRR